MQATIKAVALAANNPVLPICILPSVLAYCPRVKWLTKEVPLMRAGNFTRREGQQT